MLDIDMEPPTAITISYGVPRIIMTYGNGILMTAWSASITMDSVTIHSLGKYANLQEAAIRLPMTDRSTCER